MADEIDDLLDEVESKFVINKSSNSSKNVKTKSNSSSTTSSSSSSSCNFTAAGTGSGCGSKYNTQGGKLTQSRMKASNVDNDLDAMIDDIMGMPSEPQLKPVGNSGISCKRIVTSAQKKCFPIFLGGTRCEQGLASSIQSKCCDRLRCTDCDFKIVQFDNCKWHSSTDYLFLRNNVPDHEKLRAKLTSELGTRSYACQCKWTSIRELTDLRTCKDLKWICGKH
ncbi:cilia- and flagella-associated protein 418-like [Tubulanus polymorphus]|uniref:cilia- and flagella-associated protein 418-like n=1 Tax=Tubulanus polymorphus TaxID=672921 RepID=UPI003DA6CB10